MRFTTLLRSAIARRRLSSLARREQLLQDFARSLERQYEADLLDLLASLPRAECATRNPETETKRTLVLTRLHRLTMEADALAGAA